MNKSDLNNSSGDSPAKQGLKLAAGLILFIWGTVKLFRSHSDGDIFGVLAGTGLLILAAALLAPMLAKVVAEPAGRLFYPGDRLARPQPAYSVPRSKRVFGKYEEALEELRNIAREYPEELEAWTEMLDIAVVELKDGERAHAIYHEGLTVLQNPETRSTLGRTFHAMMIRLKEHQEINARNQQPFRLELTEDGSSEKIRS